MEGKIKKAIQLLEAVTNKKVILKEVGFSTETNFFNFEKINNKPILKDKNLVYHKNNNFLYKYKNRGKLLYLYTIKQEIILVLEAIDMFDGVEVNAVQKNPEFTQKALPYIIEMYQILANIYGRLYSGNKLTKGGQTIWEEFLNKGIKVFKVHNYENPVLIKNKEQLYEVYEDNNEQNRLCIMNNTN